MASPIYDQKIAAATWHNSWRALKGRGDQSNDLLVSCDLETGNVYGAITTCLVLSRGLSHMLSLKNNLNTNPPFTSVQQINRLKLEENQKFFQRVEDT